MSCDIGYWDFVKAIHSQSTWKHYLCTCQLEFAGDLESDQLLLVTLDLSNGSSNAWLFCFRMLWPFGATRKHDAQSNTQKSGIVMDSQGMKLAKRRIVYAIPNLLAGLPPALLAVAPINSTAEGSFSNAGNNSVDILSKHDHGVVKTAGFWDVLRCSEPFAILCCNIKFMEFMAIFGRITMLNHPWQSPLTVLGNSK